jgi:hypothetical protein
MTIPRPKPKRKNNLTNSRAGMVPKPEVGLPNRSYHEKEISVLSQMGLSEQQALFVIYYVLSGNASSAAEGAGFSARWGRAMLTKPVVCEAIGVLFDYRMKSAGPIAWDILMKVVSDPQAENKDLLAAAKLIIEQRHGTGKEYIPPVTKDTVEGLKELQDQIGDLSRQLGLDAKGVKTIEGIAQEIKDV